jgi:hypothetical protein
LFLSLNTPDTDTGTGTVSSAVTEEASAGTAAVGGCNSIAEGVNVVGRTTVVLATVGTFEVNIVLLDGAAIAAAAVEVIAFVEPIARMAAAAAVAAAAGFTAPPFFNASCCSCSCCCRWIHIPARSWVVDLGSAPATAAEVSDDSDVADDDDCGATLLGMVDAKEAEVLVLGILFNEFTSS